MSDPLVRIGNEIRQLRLERGLSQEAMAELASLSRAYYGRIERGDTDFSLSTLMKLGAALGMATSDILKRVGI
ncbi:hypothetical protein ASD79_03300 [Caulobacter sp. Root655]|uniref:helix-turn-helix domain-containing protein n=1 Tax=Caulobacter sp. Root655 TaxID=1736578 RepID=UPI0007000223|nr:helix-turn-helix transcriptional regulator [Caulobacter sp. Root655]KRA66596.1 hypothetical protein ASD79_03300 [Caulobacter sp. Root655]